jgi:hypothetical protein
MRSILIPPELLKATKKFQNLHEGVAHFAGAEMGETTVPSLIGCVTKGCC